MSGSTAIRQISITSVEGDAQRLRCLCEWVHVCARLCFCTFPSFTLCVCVWMPHRHKALSAHFCVNPELLPPLSMIPLFYVFVLFCAKVALMLLAFCFCVGVYVSCAALFCFAVLSLSQVFFFSIVSYLLLSDCPFLFVCMHVPRCAHANSSLSLPFISTGCSSAWDLEVIATSRSFCLVFLFYWVLICLFAYLLAYERTTFFVDRVSCVYICVCVCVCAHHVPRLVLALREGRPLEIIPHDKSSVFYLVLSNTCESTPLFLSFLSLFTRCFIECCFPFLSLLLPSLFQ